MWKIDPEKLATLNVLDLFLENIDGVGSWMSLIMVNNDMFIPFDQYHSYWNIFLKGLWQEKLACLH